MVIIIIIVIWLKNLLGIINSINDSLKKDILGEDPVYNLIKMGPN